MIDLKPFIFDIPDFPKPGILFRDISPLLANVFARNSMLDGFDDIIQKANPTVLAGLDARGFLIAGLLAERYQLPVMMIRKSGKLPGEVISEKYDLEYGSNELEIQKDFLSAQDSVLIIDDLLATGGTLAASINLIGSTPATIVGAACVIELVGLRGKEKFSTIPFSSLVQY